MSQGKGGGPAPETESVVLALVSEGRKSIKELVEKTGKSTRAIKSCLTRLKQKGKVAPCGKGVYRAHGPAVSPLREEEIPTDDHGDAQVQSVLGLLRERSAPLRDVKLHLGVSALVAQRVLRRMRAARMIAMSGTKRTAVYSLPGAESAPKSAKRREARPETVVAARQAAENPVVVALLAQRDRAARELDKINRMLAIAREE